MADLEVAMQTKYPTVSELVAVLTHTSIPTIVVEGKDDMTILRWLERQLGIDEVALLVCHGRSDLLGVYERRNEYPGVSVAFLADQDLWIFQGIPQEFAEIVFTEGYSIENDLLRSAKFERLLEDDERVLFDRDLEQLATWFAFVWESATKGVSVTCSYHPNRLIPSNTGKLCKDICDTHHFQDPPRSLSYRTRRSYKRYIRGKSLIELLLRYLSHPKRKSKFSRHNLLELGVKGGRRPTKLLELVDALEVKLS